MQHVATTHLGSDFERVVVQKLWRLESLVEQVGDFASSGKADTVPCGEETTCVFPGAVIDIFLHIGERLAAQLVPDAQGSVVARLVTACGVAVEEVAFFNDSEPGTHLAFGHMDNPDFW